MSMRDAAALVVPFPQRLVAVPADRSRYRQATGSGRKWRP